MSASESISLVQTPDNAVAAGYAPNSRILVVSPELPRPDEASGDRRFYELLKMLANRHKVDFCAMRLQGDNSSISRSLEHLKSIRVQYKGFGRDYLQQVLFSRHYELLWCEFWHAAEWAYSDVRRAQPWMKILVDTVDVHFLREEAALKLGEGDAQAVAHNKERELNVYRQADAVLVVTEEDGDALRLAGSPGKIFTVPNITALRDRPRCQRGADLLFVGGFRHFPNVDGLVWFSEVIFPKVKQEIPDARLTVVGSNAPESIRALGRRPGIKVVGYVGDTGPCLDRAAISVAPLRFGAGMKGKVTEAMGAGLPVVTTSVGAQGLQAKSGVHLIIADEPSEFAAEIVKLLKDPVRAEEIGRAGRAHIEKTCSVELVERNLHLAVGELASDHSKIHNAKWYALAPIFHLFVGLRFAVKTLGGRKLKRLLCS